MIKKALCLLMSIIIIIGCFVGCNKEDQLQPTESTETTNTEATKNPNDTKPNQRPSNTLGLTVSKYLWEKDYGDFALQTIKIPKQWDEFVIIGNAVIESTKMVDVSNIDNYFYKNANNTDSHPLSSAYHVDTINLSISTERTQFDRFVSGSMKLTLTTFVQPSQKNVVIEGIRSNVGLNVLEGGYESFKSMNAYQDGDYFGLGSTMTHVVSLIGEPSYEFDEDAPDGMSKVRYVYDSEAAFMSLEFLWNGDNMDEAVVTSIVWTPKTVRGKLHSQTDIESFVGYDSLF